MESGLFLFARHDNKVILTYKGKSLAAGLEISVGEEGAGLTDEEQRACDEHGILVGNGGGESFGSGVAFQQNINRVGSINGVGSLIATCKWGQSRMALT
jgi:hypothetical protein